VRRLCCTLPVQSHPRSCEVRPGCCRTRHRAAAGRRKWRSRGHSRTSARGGGGAQERWQGTRSLSLLRSCLARPCCCRTQGRGRETGHRRRVSAYICSQAYYRSFNICGSPCTSYASLTLAACLKTQEKLSNFFCRPASSCCRAHPSSA
jgi:hypothetical protein